VVYICGSDEHGAAITIKAKKENTTPQAIIDKYHHQIKQSFEEFGSRLIFITAPHHPYIMTFAGVFPELV
jgi:methionyl-tRNA synthetase